MLRRAGYGASRSHCEAKAIKTSASLAQVVRLVHAMQTQWLEEAAGAEGAAGVGAEQDWAAEFRVGGDGDR